MTTVSARPQILHAARLVARRREGKSVIYGIADEHVLTLVDNAVAHAGEKHRMPAKSIELAREQRRRPWPTASTRSITTTRTSTGDEPGRLPAAGAAAAE